jgi:SAM-dependent methyltransferase
MEKAVPGGAAEIRTIVAKLAPWYYRFEIAGVRTDEWPACDASGHREITVPAIREGFWRGKRVLDVGCNEGAWSFGVLGHGAASVEGFDCREINVEKARFLARVLEHADRARFEVGSCDTWFDRPRGPYDVIVFPGVMYHLPAPWDTVGVLCDHAREGILVGTVLWGGEPGYTRYEEGENIAASEDALPSWMPNDLTTVVEEFARHGFHPTALWESRTGWAWGGMTGMLKNCRDVAGFVAADQRGYEAWLEVHVTPDLAERGGGAEPTDHLDVCVYNRRPSARRLVGALDVVGADGSRTTLLEGAIDVEARIDRAGDPGSRSTDVRIPCRLPSGPVRVEVRLRDEASGESTTRVARFVVP